MKSALLIAWFLAAFQFGNAQSRILHYTETSGFDHQTRTESLAMFEDIVAGYFVVDDDQTGDAFNSLSNLQQYSLVVFSNTSGDAILNANQRSNFEAYINDGGSFMGIHAASDTYRHSSANGTNTGAWDFYAELVGASVQQNPNHVSGTPEYEMVHIGSHNSTSNLPDPWIKNEEYYYWENGYCGTENNAVLEVEETIGPNNMVNSYDAPRPMSWYRELNQGGMMFYTALGHSASNYTSDQNFINHIRDAVFSMVPVPTEIPDAEEKSVISIEQFGSKIWVSVNKEIPDHVILFDMLGRKCFENFQSGTVEIGKFPKGIYLLKASHYNQLYFKKLYVR